VRQFWRCKGFLLELVSTHNLCTAQVFLLTWFQLTFFSSSKTRHQTSIMQTFQPQKGNRMQHKEVDVRKLNMNERQQIIAKIFKVVEEDNEKCL